MNLDYKVNYSNPPEFQTEDMEASLTMKRPLSNASSASSGFGQNNLNIDDGDISYRTSKFSNSNLNNSNSMDQNQSQNILLNNRPDINLEKREEFKKILHDSLVKMIDKARQEKAFIRKYTRFDPIDFLVEELYNYQLQKKQNNETGSSFSERVPLNNIPFVQKSLKENPRKEKRLCMRIGDEEAAVIIQKFYRGYKVRKENEVQELRKWQADYRSIHEGVE